METFVQGVQDGEEFSWTCACCIKLAAASPFLFETSDDYRCALQRVSSTGVEGVGRVVIPENVNIAASSLPDMALAGFPLYPFAEIGAHQYSASLLAEYPQVARGHTAGDASGNGNCLFNSASRLIDGKSTKYLITSN